MRMTSLPDSILGTLDAPLPGAEQITVLLARWSGGESVAFDDLVQILYPELHRLAAKQMGRERPGHTLNTTGLLHEACLRLMGANMSWNDRAHFMAVAATTIRRILIDHARSKQGARRNGGARVPSLDQAEMRSGLPLQPDPADILAVNQALDRLLEQDARKAKLMEMLYFGGLSCEEAAVVLRVSVPTVNRDLKFAKAWMRNFLTASPSIPSTSAC